MTYLDENRQQAKLMEYRKELLANVSIFDGKDKKSCLMWVNQCAHTTVNAKMSLKELLVAKAGPIVSTQVQTFLSRVPDATNAEIKQHILECFSNVGTRTEAHHYLTRMTLDEDESLLAHNSEYAAVHKAAHGITPEEEKSEIALMDYVRTLPQITCDELTKQITCPKSKIHNLREAMNMAESLDRQGRQRELNRQERSALRETTIREEAVNKMSIQEEVNFMSGRNDGHFNSTMKNNSGRWNNSPNRNNWRTTAIETTHTTVVVETTRTRGGTTPTQTTDRTETTPTTGAGTTTKAGTPGTITLIIMIPEGD